MDRIRQSRKISASDDLILTGQVVWVGNSSLDVLMEIHRLKDIKVNPGDIDDGGAVMIKENVPSRLLSSLFTYVARDRQTGKSCAVNRFIPSGKDEEELCARRNALALSRKSAKKVVVKNGGNGLGEGVDSQVITFNLSYVYVYVYEYMYTAKYKKCTVCTTSHIFYLLLHTIGPAFTCRAGYRHGGHACSSIF